MHLFFENCVPHFTRHLRGKGFRPPDQESDNKDGGTKKKEAIPKKPEDPEHHPADRKGKRKAPTEDNKTPKRKQKRTRGKRKLEGDEARLETTRVSRPKPFIDSGDPYCIHPDTWKRIGLDSKSNNATMPAVFCDTMTDFTSYCNRLKAANWKLWTLSQSPILYLGALAEPFYSEYINLVEAIRLSVKHEISPAEIEEIRNKFFRFTGFFEKHIYRHEYGRISACLPSFHQLRHVADEIEQMGPMYVYSQWTCERACGMMCESVKSRVSPNENMAISLEIAEKTNALEYVLPEYAKDRDHMHEFLDKDGQTQLSAMLAKYHRIITGKEELVIDFTSHLITDPDNVGLVEFTDLILTDAAFATKEELKATGCSNKTSGALVRQRARIREYLSSVDLVHFPLPNDRDPDVYRDDGTGSMQEQINFEDRYFRLTDKGLSKWRSLKRHEILKLDGKHIVDVRETRITSSEVVPRTKKRASWFVEYSLSKEQAKRRALSLPGSPDIYIAEVLYYIEVKIPAVSTHEEDGVIVNEFQKHPTEEGMLFSEAVQLAYIQEIPVEAKRVGHSLDEDIVLPPFRTNADRINATELYTIKVRDPNKTKGRKWFIECDDIKCLVGLMKKSDDDGIYVVWDEGSIRRRGEHFSEIFKKK